ncbi:hypothetical protein TNCV_1094281 [Trichonephila clavipes]|uniref:Uncharacterized protein n=1 Tax=Trichonephila clavipes TaxID=2585209 RepID=A0A8X6REE9_TRICX|nr:hypothetical protein TNCV_1094281 [Trichonephila clavipes]
MGGFGSPSSHSELPSSDYNLFRPLRRHLGGQYFSTYAEFEKTVLTWVNNLDTYFTSTMLVSMGTLHLPDSRVPAAQNVKGSKAFLALNSSASDEREIKEGRARSHSSSGHDVKIIFTMHLSD